MLTQLTRLALLSEAVKGKFSKAGDPGPPEGRSSVMVAAQVAAETMPRWAAHHSQSGYVAFLRQV